MSRRSLALGVFAAASISLALPFVAAAQPAPAPTEQSAPKAPNSADPADELFAQGNEAFDKGALDTAYDLYQKAWALKRTFDIAGNLGQVELKLGRFRDAAEHLDFTIRLFPPTGKAAPREAIRRALMAARKEVGALTVTVNVQGASVLIDGKSVGLSPFEAPIFVDPGKRTVEATLEAHLPTRIVIDIGKDESRNVGLSLTPKNQPPPPPRNLPLLITGFGLSLAAAGTGIGLMLASSSKGSDADALLSDLVASEPDGKCPCGSDEERGRLKGLRQDHDLLFNVAVGAFVGAGVLAVGSAAYALTPSFQRPTTTKAAQASTAPTSRAANRRVVLPQIAPWITEQSGGVIVLGTF